MTILKYTIRILTEAKNYIMWRPVCCKQVLTLCNSCFITIALKSLCSFNTAAFCDCVRMELYYRNKIVLIKKKLYKCFVRIQGMDNLNYLSLVTILGLKRFVVYSWREWAQNREQPRSTWHWPNCTSEWDKIAQPWPPSRRCSGQRSRPGSLSLCHCSL